MVASTDIKFYVHTNNNAPQLQNAFGCMIGVLDACLVNGFGAQTASSLTVNGVVATAAFSSAHNFMQYQVVKIAGANQVEFNGEHRILSVPNANSFTFELANTTATTQASGTIVCSLPPLGWEKPFSSSHSSGVGGKAAYRSKNTLLPSRPFLRVVDELDPAYTTTYAKYAKVGIVENMTDINTMIGVQAPYDPASPNNNWVGSGSGTTAINGWAKWFYALEVQETSGTNKISAPSAGNRGYIVIGNSDIFYIFNKFGVSVKNTLFPYGFGALSDKNPMDSAASILACTLDFTAASAICTPAGNTPLTASKIGDSCLIQRPFSGLANSSSGTTLTLTQTMPFYSGVTNRFNNAVGIPVFSSKPIMLEIGDIPRGSYPIIRFLHQALPYPHMQTFSENNRMLLASRCVSSTFEGQILFDLGEG